MRTLLRVEHLTKDFSTHGGETYRAVDDVSFSLGFHEKMAVIGESGSGKTTLARMITRLTEATSGQIFLEEENITRAKGHNLRNIYQKMQMVFQMPVDSFDSRRRLGDGIAESLINRGMKKAEAWEEAERLLGECGLGKEFLTRYPHEVSGGQCLRAAIARALAIHPKLLILDEATSALDMTVQKEILGLLDSLQEDRDMSYLFICHDLALVQAFCDRMIVMQKGKIVEEGTTDQVIRHPKHAYTKMLMDSVL